MTDPTTPIVVQLRKRAGSASGVSAERVDDGAGSKLARRVLAERSARVGNTKFPPEDTREEALAGYVIAAIAERDEARKYKEEAVDRCASAEFALLDLIGLIEPNAKTITAQSLNNLKRRLLAAESALRDAREKWNGADAEVRSIITSAIEVYDTKIERTFTPAQIMTLASALSDARENAIREAAEIADAVVEKWNALGMKAPFDSEQRSRDFARSRTASDLASAIRALLGKAGPNE